MSANLSQRQQEILKAVVTEYVRTAAPIGSKELVEQYQLEVSPATIRNEMGLLEDLGLLRQPHTSAGRIPTERGYRVYVQSMLTDGPVFRRQRQVLERRLSRIRHHYERLARETAELLADVTQQGAIAQTGDETERSGLGNLINLPELKDNDIARAVAQAFDHPELIVQKLTQADARGQATTLPVAGGSPIEVFIGAETGFGRVPLTVLSSTFTLEPGREGHLLIIGPSRMQYSRNVALLSYMGRMLTRYVRSQKRMISLVAIVLPTALIIQQIPHT